MVNFVLPPLSDLIPPKEDIIAFARLQPAPVQGDTEAVKKLAVTSVLMLAQTNLAHAITKALDEQVASYTQLYGARDGQDWDDGLDEEVKEFMTDLIDAIDEENYDELALGVRLDDPGRTQEVAEALAEKFAPLWLPEEESRGRWLAKWGIVKADLDALAEEDASDRPAPPLIEGQPTPELLTKAYNLFRDACSFKDLEVAGSLGMSRTTFINYSTGRTPARASIGQARTLAAQCDSRAALLAEAASIFGAVTRN